VFVRCFSRRWAPWRLQKGLGPKNSLVLLESPDSNRRPADYGKKRIRTADTAPTLVKQEDGNCALAQFGEPTGLIRPVPKAEVIKLSSGHVTSYSAWESEEENLD
jgi:hypothetical protein